MFTSGRHRSRKQSDVSDNDLVQYIPKLQQRSQYDVSCQQGIGHMLYFQTVHQLIVKGMRGFGCLRESGRLVAWQCTPAFVIERDGGGHARSSNLWIGRPVSQARNVHFERP